MTEKVLYLRGYSFQATEIREDLKKYGWARVKGEVKAQIKSWIEALGPIDMNTPLSPYVSGMVDALLDSVN